MSSPNTASDLAFLDPARALIGGPANAVPTPALLVDRTVLRENIAAMARRMEGLPAALRPHAKIHKSPEIGRMQLEAGAIGLTTATVWEASAMIAEGISEILVCNQVVGPVKADELARIAGLAEVIVLVESEVNADQLAARRSQTPAARSASWSSSTSACTGPVSAASIPRSSSPGTSMAPTGCACAACSATRATACSSRTATCGCARPRRRTLS